MATPEQMDKAAAEAQRELEGHMADTEAVRMAVKYVAGWLQTHYMKAGYKRLCKVLLKHA